MNAFDGGKFDLECEEGTATVHSQGIDMSDMPPVPAARNLDNRMDDPFEREIDGNRK